MQPPVPSIEVDEVAASIAQGALLVDIREQDEWDAGRIAGADFLPMSLIHQWWETLPTDRTVILYCRSGRRSANVITSLMGQGLGNLLNMTGGILAWQEAGLEVLTGSPDLVDP